MTERDTLASRYQPGAVRSALDALLVPGMTISDAVHELALTLWDDDSRPRRQQIYKWLTGRATPRWARDQCMLVALPAILARHGLPEARDVLAEDEQIMGILGEMQ